MPSHAWDIMPGYSKTPLAGKLGITEDTTVHLIGASKVPTDITEDVIREVPPPIGFVDIKVCAVDDTWSGLKLVIRRELR